MNIKKLAHYAPCETCAPTRRCDYGNMSLFGEICSSKRRHKQYLRTNKLGKFSKSAK